MHIKEIIVDGQIANGVTGIYFSLLAMDLLSRLKYKSDEEFFFEDLQKGGYKD